MTELHAYVDLILLKKLGIEVKPPEMHMIILNNMGLTVNIRDLDDFLHESNWPDTGRIVRNLAGRGFQTKHIAQLLGITDASCSYHKNKPNTNDDKWHFKMRHYFDGRRHYANFLTNTDS